MVWRREERRLERETLAGEARRAILCDLGHGAEVSFLSIFIRLSVSRGRVDARPREDGDDGTRAQGVELLRKSYVCKFGLSRWRAGRLPSMGAEHELDPHGYGP